LSPAPGALMTTFNQLAKNGAQFMVDDAKLSADLKKLGATPAGPAYTVKEMLDRKTPDTAPAVLSQIGSDTYS
jgi:hypothetical protein